MGTRIHTVLVVIAAGTIQITAGAVEKPNVIYILMDDLGYGDAGCYGQEKIETPNIDNLAKNGMRFTQHYSGAPVSAPSRCVLMTGMHSGHAQIRENDELASRGNVRSLLAMQENPGLEGQFPLVAGTVTIGTVMQKAGYKTGITGKWGLGFPGSTGTPEKQGFDYFYGYNCQRVAHTYFPPTLWENTTRVRLNNEILEPHTKLSKGADPKDPNSYAKYWKNDYANDFIFNATKKFIAQNAKAKTPFFLVWATPLPHVPLQAPKKWVDYYHKKFGDESPYLGNSGYFPCLYPKATYAAMVSYFDEQIGEVMAQLKTLGIEKNTLVIFSSDNGPTFNGGTASPWFDSAKPFKSEYGWGKCFLREGGIRVPMIASWQGKIARGTTSTHISGFQDLMPTLCELAGTATPKNTDGISFLPTLLGKSSKQKNHKFLYWEFPDTAGQKAVRFGKWKAIIPQFRKNPDKLFLYNIEKDPREQHDLAAENPKIVDQIRKFMEDSHTVPANKKFEI